MQRGLEKYINHCQFCLAFLSYMHVTQGQEASWRPQQGWSWESMLESWIQHTRAGWAGASDLKSSCIKFLLCIIIETMTQLLWGWHLKIHIKHFASWLYLDLVGPDVYINKLSHKLKKNEDILHLQIFMKTWPCKHAKSPSRPLGRALHVRGPKLQLH